MKVANDPRHHHYIPEAYLSGFTSNMLRSTPLFVTDLQTRSQFQAVPKKVAKNRDFYRVRRSDKGDRQIVEKWLNANIDSDGARLLRLIDAHDTTLSSDEFMVLMKFIASLAVRGPYFRYIVDHIIESSFREVISALIVDERAFKTFISTMPPIAETDVDHETALRNYAASNDTRMVYEQTYHIDRMLALIPDIASLLASRNWHVVHSDQSGCAFICSDNPVSVMSRTAPKEPWMIPFDAEDAIVFFPVSRRTMLIGTRDRGTFVAQQPKRRCAIINAHTLSRTSRFVFSDTAEIVWMGRGEQICGTKELLEQWGGATHSKL